MRGALLAVGLLVAWPALAGAADGGVLDVPAVEVPVPAAEATPASPQVRDPSGTVTVIDAKERRGEALDTGALLLEAPGAVVQDSGGSGQRKTVSLRGAAGNGVMVLLDGVPLTGPGKAMDLSRVPTAAIDRLEVLRGAGARYGPGAMGGVVNLVTRAPDGTHVFAEATQGNFNTTQGSVGGSLTLPKGDGLVLLHALHSDGDFVTMVDDKPALDGNPLVPVRRLNNQALQGGGVLRYRTDLGRTALHAMLEGFLETRGLAGTVQNPTQDAAQDTARGMLSVRTASAFEAGGELSLLGYGRLEGTTLRGSPFGPKDFRQLEGSAGVEAVYSRLFFSRHGLTALVSGGGEWLKEPTHVDPSWGRAGVMLGDEVLFLDGDLALSVSARADVAGPFVVFSPKAGLTVQLPWGFEVRANGGQASRPPGFGELYVVQGTLIPNAALRPERALTADASLGWRYRTVQAQVTGFGSLYEDLISWEYYPPALARPYNFQAASVAGVEAEGSWKPARWLSLSATYTWLSTKNLKDDPRYYLKSLPFRPEHRVTARVWAGVPLASVHGEVLWQALQYANRTETFSLPARAFVNLGVSSTFLTRPELTVSFEVKNVLDVMAQDSDGYPLPPRAAYLTFAVAWDAAPRRTP